MLRPGGIEDAKSYDFSSSIYSGKSRLRPVKKRRKIQRRRIILRLCDAVCYVFNGRPTLLRRRIILRLDLTGPMISHPLSPAINPAPDDGVRNQRRKLITGKIHDI